AIDPERQSEFAKQVRGRYRASAFADWAGGRRVSVAPATAGFEEVGKHADDLAEQQERGELKEESDDVRTLRIVTDESRGRRKPWRSFAREMRFDSYNEWPSEEQQSQTFRVVRKFDQ
ncbi:unnamed protein product, partial [Prorocentrum cordatum]